MGSPNQGHGVDGAGGGGGSGSDGEGHAGSWRLRMDSGGFTVADRFHRQSPFYARIFGGSDGKQRKIAKYYKKQEYLLKDFSEMETMNELGGLDQNVPSEEEQKQLAKSERFAINLSNVVNLILFVTKVVASIESVSMAVIASTLDSLLDLLSGFILCFTVYKMKKPNKYIAARRLRRSRFLRAFAVRTANTPSCLVPQFTQCSTVCCTVHPSANCPVRHQPHAASDSIRQIEGSIYTFAAQPPSLLVLTKYSYYKISKKKYSYYKLKA